LPFSLLTLFTSIELVPFSLSSLSFNITNPPSSTSQGLIQRFVFCQFLCSTQFVYRINVVVASLSDYGISFKYGSETSESLIPLCFVFLLQETLIFALIDYTSSIFASPRLNLFLFPRQNSPIPDEEDLPPAIRDLSLQFSCALMTVQIS
jgi:hypothetical protein